MDAADAFEGGALRDVVQKEASKWLYFARLVAAAFADHAGVEATRALRTVLWAKAVVATRVAAVRAELLVAIHHRAHRGRMRGRAVGLLRERRRGGALHGRKGDTEREADARA